MTEVQELAAPTNRLMDGYVTETEMAAARRIEKRTLRAERQRGDGPPWLRISNQIFYETAAFRAWLKSIEHHPVRARKAADSP